LPLEGIKWSSSDLGYFTSGERDSGTHWIRGWLGLRASLDAVEERVYSSFLVVEHVA
jgi:hypothetical protein